MATVYEVVVISDWVNYTKEDLEKILEEKLKGESIRVRVKTRS